MFALVLQIPNENRTGFSIVHLYKRPRTENTACAKRVRPFAKIRTGESKSKLACILPGGRIFDEVKGTNNSGKAAETGPPEAFFQPNVIFSARKCAKIKNMSIFAVPKQRFWVGRTGQVLLPRPKRRGAGVVDRAALEMRCTGNCTGGSNPSVSPSRNFRNRICSSLFMVRLCKYRFKSKELKNFSNYFFIYSRLFYKIFTVSAHTSWLRTVPTRKTAAAQKKCKKYRRTDWHPAAESCLINRNGSEKIV